MATTLLPPLPTSNPDYTQERQRQIDHERMFLSPDDYVAGLPADQRTAMDAWLSWSPDPKADTRKSIVKGFLGDHYGLPSEALDNGGYEAYRNQYAREVIGIPYQGGLNDESFFELVKGQKTKERDFRIQAESFATAGATFALRLKPGDPMAEAAKMRESAKLIDGSDPEEADKYFEYFRLARQEAESLAAPLRQVAQSIFEGLSAGETERFSDKSQAAIETAIDQLAALPDDQRDLVVSMLKAEGGTDQTGNSTEKAASSAVRGMTGQLRGFASNAELQRIMRVQQLLANENTTVPAGTAPDQLYSVLGGIAANSGNPEAGPAQAIASIFTPTRKLTTEERAMVKGQADKALTRADVAAQAIAIMEGTLDPIKARGMIEKTAVNVGQSIGAMAPIAIPYAGVVIAQGGYANREYQRQRSMGVDPDTAYTAAQITGTIQAGLERTAFLFNFAPASMVGKLSPKFTTPALAASLPLQVAGKMGTIQAVEYGQEIAQDAVPIFTAKLGESLGWTVPEQARASAELERWKVWQPETFMAVAALSLFGGGFQGVRNTFEARAEMTKQAGDVVALQAMGIPAADAATVAATPEETRLEAFKAAYAKRDPGTAEAGKAQEELAARVESAAAEGQAEISSLAEAGITIERGVTPDGNTIYRVTRGEDLTTEHTNIATALNAAREHMGQADRESSGPMLEMLAELDANPLSPVREGKIILSEGETVAQFQARRAAIMQDENATPEARAQAERESAAMTRRQQVFEQQFPDGPIDWRAVDVGGQSELEVKEGVARAVIRVANGESAYTPLEEKTEAEAEAWVRSGQTTWTNLESMIRQVEQATGDTYINGFTAGQDTAQDVLAIKEAYSELAQVHATGKSRAGKAAASGITQVVRMDRQVARTNLRQAMAQGKIAAELVARLKAQAEWLRAVVTKAIRLNRARREAGGAFAIDEFLNKSVGMETEAQHAAGVIAEAERIYTPPTAEEEANGTAFSLQPKGFTHGPVYRLQPEAHKGKLKRGDYGIWFSSSKEAVSTYDRGEYPDLITAYLKLKNPLELDAKGAHWDSLGEIIPGQPKLDTTDDVAYYAEQNGYDGIIINNVIDDGLSAYKPGPPSTIYSIFSPSQARKSQSTLAKGEETVQSSGSEKTGDQNRTQSSDSVNSFSRPTESDGMSFSLNEPGYEMQHRPNPDGPRLHNLLEGVLAPRDIYQHPEWYAADPSSKEYRETIQQIRAAKGNPAKLVTIYRAAPKGAKFRNGDWVSLSKTYAKQHGIIDDNPDNDMPVISLKVPASSLRWPGDDLNEFGYYPDLQENEPAPEQKAGGVAFSLKPAYKSGLEAHLSKGVKAAQSIFDDLTEDASTRELGDAQREAMDEIFYNLPLPDGWEYTPRGKWVPSGQGSGLTGRATSSWYAEVENEDVLDSEGEPERLKLSVRDHENFSRQHESPDFAALVPQGVIWNPEEVAKAVTRIMEKLAQKSQSTLTKGEETVRGSGSEKTGYGSNPPQSGDSVNTSFRLTPNATLDALAAQMAKRTRDPEARRKVYEQISVAFDSLRSRWNETRALFDAKGQQTGESKPIGEKRTKKELDKEQAFREAAAVADAEERIMDSLSVEAQAALGMTGEDTSAYAGPLAQRFTGGRFGKPGRILAKSAMLKRAADWENVSAGGEYDGAEGLPSIFFGGSLTADEAAQEAFEAGEIADAKPDTLWDAIRKELQTQAKNQDSMKAALATLKAEQKQARNTAKEAAADWRREQDEAQAKNWDGRAVMLRHLRTLDAILSALPPDVRAKVGGWTAVASLKTQAAMQKELETRLEMADKYLEAYLKKDALAQIDALLEKARSGRAAGKKSKGKLGAAVHRFFDEVERVKELTPEQVEAEQAAYDAAIIAPDVTEAQQADLFEKQQVLDMFGALGQPAAHDAAHLTRALDLLEDVYVQGRNRWRTLEEARLAEVARLAEGGVASLGGKVTASDRLNSTAELGKYRAGSSSFKQAIRAIFGKDSELAVRWSNAARNAIVQRSEEFRTLRAEWKTLKEGLYGKGWKGDRALHDELVEKKEKTGVMLTDKMKLQRQTLPVSVAENILSGNAPGLESRYSAIDKADMRAALDLNAKLKRPKDSITLTKITGPIAGNEITLSQGEAMHLSLMWRQPQGKRPMEFHGYTADTMAEIEAFLSPRAKAVRDFISAKYRDEWGPLNSVFAGMFGVNLPQIENYAPLTFWSQQKKELTNQDPLGGPVMPQGGMSTGMLKERMEQHGAEPRAVNAVDVFFDHMRKTAHFKAFAELAREMRGVMGKKEVRAALAVRHGETGTVLIDKWMDAIEQGGLTQKPGWFEDQIAAMGGARAVAVLAWNFKSALTNSLNLLGAARVIPASDYVKGLARLFSGQLNWWVGKGSVLQSSAIIQRRLDSGTSPEMQAAMARVGKLPPGKLKAFAEAGMELHAWADAFFTSGSLAIAHDYHLRQFRADGIPEAEAQRLALQATEQSVADTAQPTEFIDRSTVEMERNASSRALFAFMSDPRQKMAIMMEAAAEKDWKRLGKLVVIDHLIAGMIIQTIANAWRDLNNDDDGDEIIDPLHWKLSDYLAAMAMGPWAAFPVFGPALQTGVSAMQGVPSNDSTIFSTAGSVGGSLWKKLGSIPEDAEPIEKASDRMRELGIAWSIASRDPRFGVAARVGSMAFDLVDNIIETQDEADLHELKMRRLKDKELNPPADKTAEEEAQDKAGKKARQKKELERLRREQG